MELTHSTESEMSEEKLEQDETSGNFDIQSPMDETTTGVDPANVKDQFNEFVSLMTQSHSGNFKELSNSIIIMDHIVASFKFAN